MSRISSIALSTLIVAIGFTSSPAFAGGSLKDEPIAPRTFAWNGLSVGIGIGAGTFSTDARATGHHECMHDSGASDVQEAAECPHSGDLKAHATEETWEWFGTVRLGYDRLVHPRLLIGAFADVDFYVDAEHRFAQNVPNLGSLSGSIERDRIWTIGARIGYLLRDDLLLYGLAGYSQMKLNGVLDVNFGDGGMAHATSLNFDKNVDGYTLGTGVEVKIDKRLSLQFEYRYMKFDGFSASGSETLGHTHSAILNGGKMTQAGSIHVDDMDEHSLRAVLVFKLGDDRHVDHAPLK